MIIVSGGDDARMKEVIENALTEAGEPFIITDDESDTITTEQAITLIVYNASKIRTYLGRLERNTRKQEEDLRRIEQGVDSIAELLEPQAVYFESKLPADISFAPRKTHLTSRLDEVRHKRRRKAEDARQRQREEQAADEGNQESS